MRRAGDRPPAPSGFATLYQAHLPPGDTRRAVTLMAEPPCIALCLGAEARYVLGDDAIVSEVAAGYSDREVEVDLLGSVLAVWQEQRGVPVLHGAAVASQTGAAILLGANGAGKSTLTLACLARGARLLADDAVALEARAGGVLAWPGAPCMRLWREDAASRRLPGADTPSVHPRTDKVRVPIEALHPGCFARAPVEVVSCFVVAPPPRTGEGVAVEPLPPARALVELIRYGAVPNLARHLPGAHGRLQILGRLVAAAPVLLLRVGHGEPALVAAAARVLESLGASAPAGSRSVGAVRGR